MMIVQTWQLEIVAVVIVIYVIYLISYFLRKKGKAEGKSLTGAVSRPLKLPGAVEKELATVKAELQKAHKEIERRDVLLATHEQKQIEDSIVKAAEQGVEKILPEKVVLFDPDRQLTGRPMYLAGGFPLLDKKQEMARLVDNGGWKTLAKLNRGLANRLVDYLYFRGAHTLHYYTAQLLPNAQWAITGTSRPVERKGKSLKLPGHCLTYVIMSSMHAGIDGLILNKYEVTQGNAAIHLAATILGPFPAELYGKIEKTLGWIKPGEENGERTISAAAS